MAQTEVKGHKSMGGEHISPEAFQEKLDRSHRTIQFDPASQGGFIRDEYGVPVSFVRSPLWRTQRKSPDLQDTDIRPVYLEPKENEAYHSVESGGELELFVWDPETGDVAPVMGPASPVPQTLMEMNHGSHFVEEDQDPIFDSLHADAKHIGFSSELTVSTLEVNFHHSTDPEERALSMASNLKKIARAVSMENWRLLPIAIFPHRQLTPEDTNPDPYVQRMAMEYIGWERVRHFLGASWQVHVETIDLEAGLKAANLLQQVSPLLYGASLAGPFVHGKIKHALEDLYVGPDMETLQNQIPLLKGSDGWHSFRYPSRWYGSPSGGIFERPLPENSELFFSEAERGLKDDSYSKFNIPSPSRLAGHHRDRVRIDIPPNGTIEIASMDTFGGHVIKLAAMQEFTKALVWKLQILSTHGGMSRYLEDNPQYKPLFKSPVKLGTLKAAEINSFLVSKNGLNTTLIGQNGNQYSGRDMFHRLVDFVAAPLELGETSFSGLPKGVVQEVRKSAIVPDERFMNNYRDENGHVSARGFYATGVGTLSFWLKQRAEELIQSGVSEEEAIKDCMNDLSFSYHEFLDRLNPKSIKAFFVNHGH